MERSTIPLVLALCAPLTRVILKGLTLRFFFFLMFGDFCIVIFNVCMGTSFVD